MNFVSMPQLVRDVGQWAERIPPHRIVAGVENSGMLPARMLANRWGAMAMRLSDVSVKDGEDLLVVDDSLNYGGAMRRARAIAPANGSRFAAVYVSESSVASLVDYHFRVVPRPRFFQWNLWKHDLMSSACIDMDGVICEDYQPGDNDDGQRYAAFLRDALPRYIPKTQVSAIVTGRLEKYRSQTDSWLAKHGVPYGRLIMMPCDKPERRREYGIARFKSEVYSDAAYQIFIESESVQAAEIAEITKKPVLLIPESGEWKLL